jgi:hypothetical protein
VRGARSRQGGACASVGRWVPNKAVVPGYQIGYPIYIYIYI